VECVCGAVVTDERRTCPLCGKMVHPDAPVEVVGRSVRGQPNIHVVRRTTRKTKRMGTLPLFSATSIAVQPAKHAPPITPPSRQLPRYQGKELIEAFVELRGTARRITDSQGALRWDFQSYQLVLMGVQQRGLQIQLGLSKSFKLDNPEAPSDDAWTGLDGLKKEAIRLGFEQRPAPPISAWFDVKFRPKLSW
jgi:hypothetical protein